MKRSFHDFDDQLPKNLMERFPEKAKQLERIIELEEDLSLRWESFRRLALEEHCEPKTKRKILRVYIRHNFVPATSEEKSHFLLTVEGRILDGSPLSSEPFCRFFDEVRVVPDQKSFVDNDIKYEWTRVTCPTGAKANCVRFKLIFDRNLPVTIQLVRSCQGIKRYEPSSGLRQLLPKLPPDPTEAEVLNAVWEYIKFYELCEKTTIKCDEPLRRITDEESMPLANIKAKVQTHLFPCKPIDIEYVLNTASFNDSGISEKRYGAAAYARAGGKCFDLSVDVIDSEAHKILDTLNKGTKTEENMQNDFGNAQRRASFLVQSILRCDREIELLNSLVTEPMSATAISTSHSSSKHPSTSISTPIPDFFENICTSDMHRLGSFIDVADDDIFSSTKYNWPSKAVYSATSY